MASIIEESNGRKRICFIAGDGKHRTLRLGIATKRDAGRYKDHVEELLQAAFLRRAVHEETAQFIASLDDVMHGKLAAVKLVTARGGGRGVELATFIDAYILDRTDAKPRTITNLKQARTDLVNHFGETKDLRTINEADADEFWRALLRRGLAANTARRICGRAKQVFRVAVRKRLMPSNPFADLKSHVQGNPEREYFLSLQDAQKVLDACPDAEWRLIFVLSRYGGLRCPSEHLALRWGDVTWDDNNGKLLVHSPKTEHHEGKESRLVPLFPELRKALMEVYSQAAEGTEFVITRYREGNQNLRTQFNRIIRKAGLEPWPKLFHNLRATRQTELAETYPIHVVCAWLGNSEAVAKKHYLQIRDEHFAQANAVSAEPKTEPTEKAAQNTAQRTLESVGSGGKNAVSLNENTPVFPGISDKCLPGNELMIPPRGVEPLYAD
jgi:integrase